MSEHWFEDGLRFGCTRCGQCCTGYGYVWVSLGRMRKIAEHLDLSLGAFTRRYVRQVGDRYSLVDRGGQDCVFWDRRSGCEIYPVRPAQCRTFPFWDEHLESPEAWDTLAQVCPGIGCGRKVEQNEILELLARPKDP